jgi:anti-sigma factor RsiW
VNWSDQQTPDNPPDELIEPFLDGDLSPDERERVLTAASQDSEFAGQLVLARSIREALRSMPSAVAPPDLVPSVMGQVRRDRRRKFIEQVRDRLRLVAAVDLRPLLATATLVAVIVTGSLLSRPTPPAVSPEAEAALAQIKWTLALVSEVTERSTNHIRRDVLEPHVLGHMSTAAQDVFDDSHPGPVVN